MKLNFFIYLVYVLLIIFIIPGMTPNMAFAAEGDRSSDTGDLSAGTIDKKTYQTTTDNSGTSTTEKTKTEKTKPGKVKTDKTKTDKTKTDKTKADETKTDKITDQTKIDKITTDNSGTLTTDNSGTSTTDKTTDQTITDNSGTSRTDETKTDNSKTSSTDNSGTSTTNGLDAEDSVDSSLSDSSSNSHRSGMGSGVSTEPATNIAVKELTTRNVISGNHVKYEFLKNVTCIMYIEYDAERTFRKTTAIVEVLKNKSTLVPKRPVGGIYKYVNIWVGENAAGLPTSLKNGLVGFRVERQWIEKNNVNESLVTLQWYNNKEWELLDTKRIGEDKDYVYFESNTSGYSFFAITEIEYDAEGNETQLQKNLGNLEGQNSIGKEPMKAAKIFISFSLPLFVLLVGFAVLKKKI